jgi:hypothetical protein
LHSLIYLTAFQRILRGLDNLTASAESDELYKLAMQSSDPVNQLLVNTAYAHEMDLAQQQLSNADGEVIELLKRHLKETQRLLRARVRPVAPVAMDDPRLVSSLYEANEPADLNVSPFTLHLCPSHVTVYALVRCNKFWLALQWQTDVDLEIILQSSSISLYSEKSEAAIVWEVLCLATVISFGLIQQPSFRVVTSRMCSATTKPVRL